MDLVTLILSCSFASIDDQLLHSVAMQQSGGAPHYVRAYNRSEGVNYEDKDRALEAIARLLEGSANAYVGLMGVPVTAAAEYEIGPEDLLDPCENIRVASVMLADYRANCQADAAPDLAGCTLIQYGTATGHSGAHFAENIVFGALITQAEHEILSEAEQVSDEIVFGKQGTEHANDSLYFELDLGDLSAHSVNKIAQDLDADTE